VKNKDIPKECIWYLQWKSKKYQKKECIWYLQWKSKKYQKK